MEMGKGETMGGREEETAERAMSLNCRWMCF